MVQCRSSSPQDHEGPDPDCRRSRPTVPMTRVNPVAKSFFVCSRLFRLRLLSCVIGPKGFPGTFVVTLVLARIFVRKSLDQDESGSQPCGRRLAVGDRARDATAR